MCHACEFPVVPSAWQNNAILLQMEDVSDCHTAGVIPDNICYGVISARALDMQYRGLAPAQPQSTTEILQWSLTRYVKYINQVSKSMVLLALRVCTFFAMSRRLAVFALIGNCILQSGSSACLAEALQHPRLNTARHVLILGFLA